MTTTSGRTFGGQSTCHRLGRVLLKTPRNAFKDSETIQRQWADLAFLGPPDLNEAVREYDNFIRALESHGVSVEILPAHPNTTMDSLYSYDSILMTNHGAVILNMGKPQRRGEPVAARAHLVSLGIPILGEISGEGTLEGGDMFWLDQNTLAVGLTYRSNMEGLRQMTIIMGAIGVTVIPVQLPHYRGPSELLHLLSVISLLAPNLALVNKSLLPVCFLQELTRRGINFVEVSSSEFDADNSICNVLAIKPRVCLMLEGNNIVKQRLEAAGCTVHTFKGNEICIKGCGGPTCITQPLLRHSGDP
ncbi:NG,NG-dimethylarginine dimethylaminohydrolase 1 [Pelomyxa schiedti]|nr:NG,NG-dimethylarginine dimethylaminohydrolase 1 [Pelomyxa schiedti]